MYFQAFLSLQLGISALFLICGMAVGVFSRRLSDIAFKRAFLDKERSLYAQIKVGCKCKSIIILLLDMKHLLLPLHSWKLAGIQSSALSTACHNLNNI